MYKIGVLSDTHGMLRPEVMDALKGCEVIFHGGDIHNQKILDALGSIAPVYAVRGNNDREWAKYLPESVTVDVAGLKIFMVHNKKFIPKDLSGVDIVIYGHSHKYEERCMAGIQYLNPGSCGPRRFNQEITMAILSVEDDSSFHIEKILIPYSEKKAKNPSGEEMPADIALMIPAIMHEIDAGKSVKQIAEKYKISGELSEQIVRMYLTHPGVDTEGILRRIGV